MSSAEIPVDEAQRLHALRAYRVLDTPAEPAFDDLVMLAAHICQAPIALVSLVDEDRQWFKARLGVEATETPRDIAFCSHTILNADGLLLVPDARADQRFCGNPMVTSAPGVRFYAGAPLVTADGHAVGALCVKDVVPRELSVAQQEALKALSRQTIALLELRRAAIERRQLDERYRLVMESIPNAIVGADREGRIGLVNAEAERLFGYARSELVGQPVDCLVPPALRDEHGRRWAHLLADPTGRPEAVCRETLGLHESGRTLPIELGLTLLETPEQTFVLESITDVAERKAVESQLRRVQMLHQAIVDNAGCAIVSTDADGIITSFNPAAERMFGHAASEVVGLQTAEILHAADDGGGSAPAASSASGPLRGFAAVLDRQGGEGARECEWTCVHKDGSRLPVLLSVTALHDADGPDAGHLALAIDISHRKRDEETLRAKNEELKTFAYTVSHDLKAPLRGIAGYAQELQRRHAEGLSERAQFCIAQIVYAAKNLDRLIDDLLSYSRIVAQVPQRGEFRLDELVRRILHDRSLALSEQSVELDLDVPPIVLSGWERGLHQVLCNLIDNALKYSRDAQPPRMAVRARAAAGTCHFSVADNGIGFDMKYHDRIFGLFNRLVRANEFEGTGAGLAIVSKVLEKLGGRVRAESAPGRGATFFIDLPQDMEGIP
ncbi:MAG TPA: PAS domain S-box protein [Burkholderiaceae bacterium]|nr:PAS domain S-box protein [Burkholderiaceae bacterium]